MKLILSILSILSFYSCSQTKIQNPESETIVTVNEIHNHNQNETLRFNEDKKWVVVKDMMTYLEYMKSDVNSFKGTTLQDYQTLSTDLLINIDLLTANCTMKGDAHDQLHLWLVPFIEQVNTFSSMINIEDLRNESKALKNTFEVFDTYFK